MADDVETERSACFPDPLARWTLEFLAAGRSAHAKHSSVLHPEIVAGAGPYRLRSQH